MSEVVDAVEVERRGRDDAQQLRHVGQLRHSDDDQTHTLAFNQQRLETSKHTSTSSWCSFALRTFCTFKSN